MHGGLGSYSCGVDGEGAPKRKAAPTYMAVGWPNHVRGGGGGRWRLEPRNQRGREVCERSNMGRVPCEEKRRQDPDCPAVDQLSVSLVT